MSGEYDEVGAIIRYEGGELDQEDVVELFQRLVDSGLAWKLQGHYGRAAAELIDAGEVVNTPTGKEIMDARRQWEKEIMDARGANDN